MNRRQLWRAIDAGTFPNPVLAPRALHAIPGRRRRARGLNVRTKGEVMAGVTKSIEVWNAREQVLTSDLMRAQFLSSRDDQDILADASTDVSGVPISGLSGPCSLTAASGFAMALSAAQAFVYNPGDPGLTADDSPYEIARWALQNLTFGSPSGNPRIDLVVATPAMAFNADNQSRFVLVDPVARTIAAQNVFKTSNPQATIAIIAGTPAGTPVPPAVPSGAVALFEVVVPTGAGSSAAFGVVPRLFRRAPFPWTNFSGIVSGFVPKWDLTADPTTTSSTISFGALDDCRVVIDGEYIETLGALLEVYQDGAANPFASAASTVWNKPPITWLRCRRAPRAAEGRRVRRSGGHRREHDAALPDDGTADGGDHHAARQRPDVCLRLHRARQRRRQLHAAQAACIMDFHSVQPTTTGCTSSSRRTIWRTRSVGRGRRRSRRTGRQWSPRSPRGRRFRFSPGPGPGRSTPIRTEATERRRRQGLVPRVSRLWSRPSPRAFHSAGSSRSTRERRSFGLPPAAPARSSWRSWASTTA